MRVERNRYGGMRVERHAASVQQRSQPRVFQEEELCFGDLGVRGAAVRTSFSVDRDFYAFENGGAFGWRRVWGRRWAARGLRRWGKRGVAGRHLREPDAIERNGGGMKLISNWHRPDYLHWVHKQRIVTPRAGGLWC